MSAEVDLEIPNSFFQDGIEQAVIMCNGSEVDITRCIFQRIEASSNFAGIRCIGEF